MPVMSSVSWVSWSWWSASCWSAAVIGSSVMWSVPGVGGAVAGGPFGGYVVGDASGRRHEDRVRGVLGGWFCGEVAEAAGAAVGGVLPGAGQTGDDGGA